MTKLHIYLDTSIISAYNDARAPERMADTRDFWLRLGEYEVSVSSLVREEVEQTVDLSRKREMIGLLAGLPVHVVNAEMGELAYRYIDAGLFTVPMFNDALHVAVAVLTRQDVLLSWNFKHLVNRRKRAEVNQVNISLGLPLVEILAPTEL
ncbi:MAG: PIN domain-containing protein [Armatimonadetes bacterium]|nr:PIN domain-containing protein [Armatimonadota bacterium]